MSKKTKTLNAMSDQSWVNTIVSMLPAIVFALSITIIRAHFMTRSMTQFFWSEKTDTTQIVDFFSYNKMVVIIVCGIAAAVFFLIRYLTQNLRFEKNIVYVFAGVYALFVLLSYIFSDYKEFAGIGMNERFEGTWTLLSYIAVFLYIRKCVKTERDVRCVLYAVSIAMVAIGIVGLFQASGNDPFATVAGQKFFTPNYKLTDGSTLWQAIDAKAAEGLTYWKFNFTEKQVYQTVFNINYVPYYLSLILPVCAVVWLYAWDEKSGISKKERIVTGVISMVIYVILLINFFCANSASGYFGLIVMVITALVIFGRNLKKHSKPLLVFVAITAITMLCLSGRWWPETSSKLKDVLNIQSVQQAQPAADSAAKPSFTRLTVDRVMTYDKSFSMTMCGRELICTMDDQSNVTFTDGDGQVIYTAYDSENSCYKFSDEFFSQFATFTAAKDEDGQFYITINAGHSNGSGSNPWTFKFADDGVYYRSLVGKFLKIDKEVETWGFDGHESFGSGRGYIWARALPMIKHSLIVGPGADTFCIYFPQYDYAGKYTFQTLVTVTDKPHDMYLDILINTGLISFIAWVGIVVCFFVEFFKNSFKLSGKHPFLEYVGCGCAIGVAAFLVVGIFNDTSVSVMPTFYTVLGIGFACNMMLSKIPENNA